MISDETMNFSVEREKNNQSKEILKQVYDALKEKGSCQAVYYGHDHVNDYGAMYDGILLSYMQPSGYAAYNMSSKFDAPENEWIQGCTVLNIKANGTYTAERIFNHQ